MQQILLGVAFLQQHLGVAHRDLSLENVLLRNGKCKIADFGLSTDATHRCFECVGKEFYIAPEVVACGRGGDDSDASSSLLAFSAGYDPVKADVWSLGIMLFILLTGSPLLLITSLDQDGFTMTADKGVCVVFVAWRMRPRLSRELVDPVDGMLRVNPTDHLSMAEILNHPVIA